MKKFTSLLVISLALGNVIHENDHFIKKLNNFQVSMSDLIQINKELCNGVV